MAQKMECRQALPVFCQVSVGFSYFFPLFTGFRGLGLLGLFLGVVGSGNERLPACFSKHSVSYQGMTAFVTD